MEAETIFESTDTEQPCQAVYENPVSVFKLHGSYRKFKTGRLTNNKTVLRAASLNRKNIHGVSM
jgi:hypothetical protein